MLNSVTKVMKHCTKKRKMINRNIISIFCGEKCHAMSESAAM